MKITPKYDQARWESAHEAAEVVTNHPEIGGLSYDHIYFLAQILEVSQYPQVRDAAWMQVYMDGSFAIPTGVDYKDPAVAYADAAINAVTLFVGEFSWE